MPLPVISVAQMRDWEKASWAAGRTEAQVIARVGEMVAARALRLTRRGETVLVLAGKGHNGDDARAAEKHLAERQVHVMNVSDPEAAFGEVSALLEQRPALVIDGLFGIGINRPLDEKWVALIQQINQAKLAVLAVDVPSGLNADTGQPEGAAIEATVTLTLGAPKQGMLLSLAWPYVGRLEVAADIGLIPCPVTGEVEFYWTMPDDFTGYPPPRSATAHKGDFGRVLIIAGSLGYHGAAVLASHGAQRAQPGLITLHTLETVYHAVAAQLQAVMVDVWRRNLNPPANTSAILAGPGLAAEVLPDELRMSVRNIWRDSATTVVGDASALDWLPAGPLTRNAVRVITPHPGEAARMLRISVAHLEAARANSLRELSRRLADCWVVLKGHQTMIGRSSGPIYVNSSGNPYLAQGGSGDVLAGFLTGLLAQPVLLADSLKAIRYGVWEHGAAADRLTATRNNWVVEDLTRELGRRET